MYATICMTCAKTLTNRQRTWESPCWFRTSVHPVESPVSASHRRWTPREEWAGAWDTSPWYPPSFQPFSAQGFSWAFHIIVSTSLAKSSGNLYAAKPLATTTNINQVQLESLTIIGKKTLWFGRHIWVLILIWAKSPSNINYLSVWLSLFSAIPMESH